MARGRATSNLLGQCFVYLTVLAEAPPHNGRVMYYCVCKCGNSGNFSGSRLVSRITKSCGCLRDEKRTKHGQYKSPEYTVWASMMNRCRNTNAPNYPRYGGRGITVVKHWHSFANFIADMGQRPAQHTLERIDNNGAYCPENCIWATRKTQQRNTRRNHYLTIDGVTLTLVEWAERQGIHRNTLDQRIKAGWPLELLFLPPFPQGKRPHQLGPKKPRALRPKFGPPIPQVS